MDFWRGVFSDNGSPSASRILMLLHFIIGSIWGTHVVYHTHTMIDAVTLAGLTAFVTAPYALNCARNAVTAFAGAGGSIETKP